MKFTKKMLNNQRDILERLKIGGTVFQETNTRIYVHRRIKKILNTEIYDKPNTKNPIEIVLSGTIDLEKGKFYTYDNIDKTIILKVDMLYLTRGGKKCRIKSLNGNMASHPVIVEIEGEANTTSLTLQGYSISSYTACDDDIVDYWYL